MTAILDTTGQPLPAEAPAAERHVLGSAMASSDGLAAVLTLTADDFTPGRHRAVFEAIRDLADRGAPVTPQTVLDKIGPRAGVGPFLVGLDQVALPGQALPSCLDEIRAASESRRLLRASQRIGQLADMEASDERRQVALAEIEDLAGVLTGAPTTDRAERVFNHEVSIEARKLRAREQARRILKQEQAGSQGERPPIKLGNAFLAEPDEATTFRLAELLPTGGRVILAAQYKAGKTTLMGNLVRSLVDGEPFLDRFDVLTPARRVVVVDNELSEPMMRRWLRDQDIVGTDRFAAVSLRGKVSTFDILDREVRREWAGALGDIGADVLILDCLRPVLDALGLDENTDAGRFLVAFDELLNEACIGEAVVVHHMGHNGERSRGASRLRDWPDVEWRLVRQDTEDPASPRYFSAYGRDVEVGESLLGYDPIRRRLTLSGGNRRQAAARDVLPAVLDLLASNPDGLSKRNIEKHLVEGAGEKRQAVRAAVQFAVNEQLVITFAGERRATMHVLRRTTEGDS